MERHSNTLTETLVRILTPLVRILLRYGVSCGAFTELVRRTYVDVADREFTVEGRKQSTSRIAVITGLNRKEVTRLRNLPPIQDTGLSERYNRAARVISGWLQDECFIDRKGDPKALAAEGDGGFNQLIRKYSGDMPSRAVADELIRVGAMEITPHGEYRLTARGYVPGEDVVAKLQVLGTDVRDLIETIDHNLTHSGDEARFQRKVMYDNIPVESLADFKKYSARLGQGLLEELNFWLAEHDRDYNIGLHGTDRARVGLEIHQIEEILDKGGTPTARDDNEDIP